MWGGGVVSGGKPFFGKVEDFDMAAAVVRQSYVLATGYAALMGADSQAQHLFARHYDYAVTVDQLAVDWVEFAMASRATPASRVGEEN